MLEGAVAVISIIVIVGLIFSDIFTDLANYTNSYYEVVNLFPIVLSVFFVFVLIYIGYSITIGSGSF